MKTGTLFNGQRVGSTPLDWLVAAFLILAGAGLVRKYFMDALMSVYEYFVQGKSPR